MIKRKIIQIFIVARWSIVRQDIIFFRKTNFIYFNKEDFDFLGEKQEFRIPIFRKNRNMQNLESCGMNALKFFFFVCFFQPQLRGLAPKTTHTMERRTRIIGKRKPTKVGRIAHTHGKRSPHTWKECISEDGSLGIRVTCGLPIN